MLFFTARIWTIVAAITMVVVTALVVYFQARNNMTDYNRNCGLNSPRSLPLLFENYSTNFTNDEKANAFILNEKFIRLFFSGRNNNYDGLRFSVGKDSINGLMKILLVKTGRHGYTHNETSDLEDTTAFCSNLIDRRNWTEVPLSNAQTMRDNTKFKNKYFIGRNTLLALVNVSTDILIYPRLDDNSSYFFNVTQIKKPRSLNDDLEVIPNTFYSTYYDSDGSIGIPIGLAKPERITLYYPSLIFGGGGGAGNSKPCPPFGCNDGL